MQTEFGTKVVRGVTLLQDPAREACFTCVNLDAEMADWPDMSDISRRERLHRHMNNECGALEIAAQALVDFPEAPWELRLRLARQAADEARHAAALYQRVREGEAIALLDPKDSVFEKLQNLCHMSLT